MWEAQDLAALLILRLTYKPTDIISQLIYSGRDAAKFCPSIMNVTLKPFIQTLKLVIESVVAKIVKLAVGGTLKIQQCIFSIPDLIENTTDIFQIAWAHCRIRRCCRGGRG